MPRVGLELMIPVFQRAKTVHALDRADEEVGKKYYLFFIHPLFLSLFLFNYFFGSLQFFLFLSPSDPFFR
jgi:hypothetical protein